MNADRDLRKEKQKMSFISRLTISYFVVGLILSAMVFKFTYGHQKNLWAKEFTNEAEKAILTFKNIIEINERTLFNILSFYGASQKVDREEFKTFVTPILERNKFIQALSWVPRVSDSQRVKFEDLAKKDGFTTFQITERLEPGVMVRAGSRPEYYSVFYIEPYIGNETAHGFDLASNLTRLKAIKESRDSGKILATEKIQLVQEEKKQSAVLVFVPFYGTSGVPKTIEQRREKLTGFISGVYRLGDMFNKIISTYFDKGMHLSVFEGKELSEQNNLLGEYKTDSPLDVKRVLDFSGRNWTMVLQADVNFQDGINQNIPLVSSGATFLLYLFPLVLK